MPSTGRHLRSVTLRQPSATRPRLIVSPRGTANVAHAHPVIERGRGTSWLSCSRHCVQQIETPTVFQITGNGPRGSAGATRRARRAAGRGGHRPASAHRLPVDPGHRPGWSRTSGPLRSPRRPERYCRPTARTAGAAYAAELPRPADLIPRCWSSAARHSHRHRSRHDASSTVLPHVYARRTYDPGSACDKTLAGTCHLRAAVMAAWYRPSPSAAPKPGPDGLRIVHATPAAGRGTQSVRDVRLRPGAGPI